jgi:hypothetical protein
MAVPVGAAAPVVLVGVPVVLEKDTLPLNTISGSGPLASIAKGDVDPV